MLLLIADDDRVAVETLAELLRLVVPPPLEILSAFDGTEAVAAATGVRTPDVVILDIEMPGMDGVSAALEIRRALGSRTPSLIAVTGHVGLIARPRVSGAFDHTLGKPLDVATLVRLLPSQTGTAS